MIAILCTRKSLEKNATTKLHLASVCLPPLIYYFCFHARREKASLMLQRHFTAHSRVCTLCSILFVSQIEIFLFLLCSSIFPKLSFFPKHPNHGSVQSAVSFSSIHPLRRACIHHIKRSTHVM